MHIKVMADFECWPLWHDGPFPRETGCIDPATLPISPGLAAALNAWADRLDAALDWDDPAGTIWPEGFRQDYNAEGGALAARLRDELGPGHEVRFVPWGE